MQEVTQPLAELPDDPVGTVASVEFPIVLRGYDREAVDEYVRRTAQLVAELYASRSPEGAVRRALERVGEQVSSILARAHETAEGITAQSRSEAEERLMQARAEAEVLERDARALVARLQSESERRAADRERAAEARVQELDADADRVWAERERILADVRKLSEDLAALASAAASRFSGGTTDEGVAVSAAAPSTGPADAAQDADANTDDQPTVDEDLLAEAPLEEPPEPLGVEKSPEPRGVEEPPEPLGAEEPLGVEEDSEPLAAEEDSEPLASDELDQPEDAEEYSDPLGTGEYGAVSVTEEGGEDWAVAEYEFGPGEDRTDEHPPVPADTELAEGVEAATPIPPVFEHAEEIRVEQPTSVMRPARLRVIDLRHLGHDRVIGCWQVDDVLIDPGPASCLRVLLEALGPDRPRALLLTHIHLDHAGATGALVRRWPELEVYVHERGAAHLIDPTKLLESAERLYGADMGRLWGEVLPVPESNIHVLEGGERLLEGRFEVAYTPGHASHHVSYLYGRTAFVGDVGGVRIMPEPLVVPPTPPPDVDVEAWHDSLERVLAWEPERLVMTHFGVSVDPQAQLEELSERLDTWAALARTEDLETFADVAMGEIERGAGADSWEAYTQAAPLEQLYLGLERYWQKRDPLAQPSTGPDDPANMPEDAEVSARARASTHAGQAARARRPESPLD